MTRTWQRFWRLSGVERRIVLEAAAVLIATRAGLGVAGFHRWKSWLDRVKPGTKRDDDGSSAAFTVARMEAAAERHLFFRPNCLERSLSLWWLLRRRGISSDLRIGGRKDGGRFEAHAWLECNGTVLSEPGDDHRQFVPFDRPAAPVGTQTH
jgi:Transglutaminase-like superfamily